VSVLADTSQTNWKIQSSGELIGFKPVMVIIQKKFSKSWQIMEISDDVPSIFFYWTCGSSTTCYSHLTTTTNKALSVTWEDPHRLFYLVLLLLEFGEV